MRVTRTAGDGRKEGARLAPEGGPSIGEKGARISGGQAQKIGLARSIYSDSEIIVIDEFDNNLDIKSTEKIIKFLSKMKKSRTIIIITHNQKYQKYFDNVFNISNKKIIRKK